MFRLVYRAIFRLVFRVNIYTIVGALKVTRSRITNNSLVLPKMGKIIARNMLS